MSRDFQWFSDLLIKLQPCFNLNLHSYGQLFVLVICEAYTMLDKLQYWFMNVFLFYKFEASNGSFRDNSIISVPFRSCYEAWYYFQSSLCEH